MRTQVCIIGGGPSGLLLSQILHRAGLDTVVLERQSRAHVLSRIRAGVLEGGTVQMLKDAGVGARLERDGFPHSGTYLAARNHGFRVDFDARVGKRVTVYGQTEVTADLYAARDAMEGTILHGV
ncbi:MAG: FAD-dependent monooxygenase, partial [Pseudomonadota bacterium]